MAPNILIADAVPTRADAIAKDWANRVVKNGGALPSENTQNAMARFVNELAVQKLLAKMVAVTVFVPDSLIASITPLIKVVGNDPWTNNGPFVAGDLTSAGLIGNASSKYLQSGVNPSTLVAALGNSNFASYGMTVYITSASTNNTCEIGSQASGGSADSTCIFPMFGGTLYHDCPYAGGTGRILCAGCIIGPVNGASINVRTATNAQASYNYNSVNGFRTQVTGAGDVSAQTPSTREAFVFANNNGGTASQYSDKRLSLAAFHGGMTSGEANNWAVAIQTLRTRLGGGFV